MTMHDPTKLCPICLETILQRVTCGHAGCAFAVTTCSNCDREQVVRAFMADHEEDCEHRGTQPFVRQQRVA